MEQDPEPSLTTPPPSLPALFWMFLRIGLTAFGRMCLTTERIGTPPITRTACTYSRVRKVSVSPRMSRATPNQ